MSNADNFDDFLKNSFEKTNDNIEDEGFTEKVIANLPTHRIFSVNRSSILYLSIALSVLIFLISSGYEAIFAAVTDIFTNGFHGIKPSPISFFVILVFIGVSFIISRIEHNEDLI